MIKINLCEICGFQTTENLSICPRCENNPTHPASANPLYFTYKFEITQNG